MLVNMNDPVSVLAWWKVWPARHDPMLEHWISTQPQFAPSIREVLRMIASAPALSELLAEAAKARRDAVWSRSFEVEEV